MNKIREQVFTGLFDRTGGIDIQGVSYHGCKFHNCALSLIKDPTRRSSVSNVALEDCEISASDIGPAVFRQVDVNGLVTDSLLIVWGALFERVTLAGRIGKVKINTAVHHSDHSATTQSPFDQQRHEFYSATDWALDISRARVRLLEVSGIPARLIRRDPTTQMVVTRDRALQTDWRSQISAENKYWPFAIDMFLSSGELDEVLIAPLQGPKRQVKQYLRHLHELRELGVVE